MPETIPARPLPRRPANGLLAWEATVGYLRSHYRMDAALTIQVVSSQPGQVLWHASAVWGQNGEQVRDRLSMGVALRDLWREIDRKHVIFETREALIRRPMNYADDEWIDGDTHVILNQLFDLVQVMADGDWNLTITYEPVELASQRFQIRLVTTAEMPAFTGQGATLQEACRELYRATAQHYMVRSAKKPK